MKNNLLISVDLDEWYHCRWATGGPWSRWPDTAQFFREIYGTSGPRGDIEFPTCTLLGLFEAHKLKATFFVLGEVAEYYPSLVRRVAAAGHEIACHGYRHLDLTRYDRQNFVKELRAAKHILEDLTGEPVVGFRAPNLVIEDWVLPILKELGFVYDSSVCASRALMGKFGRFQHLGSNPFRLQEGALAPGKDGLVEIPIPVFPLARLPAGSGIMTRVMGYWWTRTALRHALKSGDALYYFHPFELTSLPEGITKLRWKERLHVRRAGRWMERTVTRLLEDFRDVPKVTCQEVAAQHLGLV